MTRTAATKKGVLALIPGGKTGSRPFGMLAATLQFCECGHLPERHIGGRQCAHVIPGSEKRGTVDRLCECARFRLDPRFTDGELLARGALEEVIRRESLDIVESEKDDALADMLGDLWRASEKYDPAGPIPFRVYAYCELRNRAIDHFRHRRGREGQKRLLPPPPSGDAGAAFADGDPFDDPVGEPPSRDPGDDPDAWASSCGGLLDRDHVEGHRPVGGAGVTPARGAAAGAARSRGEGAAAAGAAGAGRGPAWIDCAACGWRSYLIPPNGIPGWSAPVECAGCGARFADVAA